MRVTNQSLSLQITEGLQQAFRRVAETQEAVTTGKRINRVSDDPIGAVRVLGLRGFEASMDQYTKNIDRALPAIEQADTVLDNVIDRLTRSKELALAMANDSNSPDQRLQTAKEVREILHSLLGLANTQVENRFIFAGFANDAAPFSEMPAAVIYGGDDGIVKVQTSANRSVAINVPGDQVFNGAGLTNGQDIFDIILDLETALQNNDVAGPDGIRSQIGRFDKAIDQILGFRAEFGARMNNTQMAKDAVSVIKVHTVEQRSQIEDADVLKTYSDLVRYQQAFQAALQSTAQVIQPSLLDFLQ